VKRRQGGIAAVTAILIVAVAASAATLMLAQQSAMLDQTLLVASRAQADLYARAGLDWARGVLLQDNPNVDHLGEGWAQPIAALPVERAVVAGAIADEQSKFNLNNLGAKGAEDMATFRNLLGALGLAAELTDAVADWIDADDDLTSGASAEKPYYLSLRKPYLPANVEMVQIEELYRVRGFDAATVAKLKPFVTALKGRTPVNVNTASETVLAAVLAPQVSPARIAKFVADRKAAPIVDKGKLRDVFPEARAAALDNLDVKSSYFSVRIQVAQDDVQVATDALVRRAAPAPPAILWRRPRY
jgi:general secretion pathway protein K